MAAPKVSTTFNAVDRISKPIKGMKKSVTGFSRHTQRSVGGISQSFSRMRGLLVGAGAAITTGAIARGINAFTEQATEIERTSRQLGLASESYQKLSFAAKQYGVEQGALRDGLKELSLRADEFAVTGAGPAAEAMERLGLSQAEINARKGDTEALFQLVNRELQGIQDVAARQRIADEIFGGTGGEQMVEMASASSEELARLFKEMEELGFISAEAGRASERFTRAMDSLRHAGRSAMSKAIVPLVDEFTPLINKTGKWISENKELISLKIQETFDRIRGTVRAVARAWESGLIPALFGSVVAFKAVSTAIVGAQGLIVAIRAVKKAMAAGSLLSLANPVTAIAAAVAGAAFLIIKHWEPISAFFRGLWQGITQSFENAWSRIKPIIDGVRRAGRFLGNVFGGGEQSSITGGAGASSGGVSPQTTPMGAGATVGAISRTVTENRSKLDVDFSNVPVGTTARQTGRAPGVSVNMGAGAML